MFRPLTGKNTVFAPATGNVKRLQDVRDDVFSRGLMGPGLAIDMDGRDCKVYSPVDGEVVALYPTGHAIGIRSSGGVELLLHVGLETFRNSDLIRKYITQGQRVRRGQPLVEIKRQWAGADDRMVILTLPGRTDGRQSITSEGKVTARKSIVIELLD
ncbi:MAG: PTS glucose transporter subunit IIA [Ignavibacteriales bacterium]